ncbi:MAG: A/G-specific adenine glycosylase [Sedimentisphaerales bacterium]|nr:A/G-specific adenine glycosylase [Sedimentisphaerales bacterium]
MKQNDRLRHISTALLDWYRANARILPWRQTRDPYYIWISEIMLQQTRVTAVVPYFQRFIARFPTIQVLAKANIDVVLKFWEGLGYYSRARNLHAAARKICKEYGGNLPHDVVQLRFLPGIGRYTAGAIASIAFDTDEPVLDGNVIRVLCRMECIEVNPKQAEVHEKLWKLARRLIPKGQAGDLNQALMELGAMVCLPKNPQCLTCPVQKYCVALRNQKQNALPIRQKKKPLPRYTIAVGVVWKNGRILIDRRPANGMLGGLWEFPGGKKKKNESLIQTVQRETLEEVGIHIEVQKKITTVHHAYSHFQICLHAFHCRWISGKPEPWGCDQVKWVWPSQLDKYAFPTANQKIIAKLLH